MLLRRGRASREVSFIDSCSEDATSRGLEILDSSPNLEMSYLQQEAVDILFSAMTQLRPGLRVAMELKELGSYPVGIRLGTWASQSALLKPAYSMDEESYGKY